MCKTDRRRGPTSGKPASFDPKARLVYIWTIERTAQARVGAFSMNLVVGATGTLGSEICRLLVAAGQPVRALIRATADADKAARLERTGVTLVRGDLKDRASLDRACRGVNTVVSTASSTISRQAGDSSRRSTGTARYPCSLPRRRPAFAMPC